MKHLRKGRKFSRTSGPRQALMKSLASSFFMLGRIQTTEAKAKELRPFVEKTITRAKNPSLANRRLLARVFSNEVVRRIIDTAGQMKERKGGYTRIAKTGARTADATRMAIIELVK